MSYQIYDNGASIKFTKDGKESFVVKKYSYKKFL